MSVRAVMLITSLALFIFSLAVLWHYYDGWAAVWGGVAGVGVLLLCVTLEVGHEFFD